ncbi:MAG: proton-conducting transporter membrane subunit [Planctomycetaceae bacterium]
MSRYWQTLLDNLAFLIFVMPLVGAGLVAASSRLGLDAIRRTALTNVLLTLALTLLMVAKFDPSRPEEISTAGHYQMTTSWRWLQQEAFRIESREVADEGAVDVLVADRSGPNVRVALGVDGISLWFIVLTTTLMIPATYAGWKNDRERPALFYGLLLILQSSLIGVFASADVIFFLVCLEIASLSLVCLIGRWGGHGRPTIVKRFFGLSLATTLMIALGLMTLVVSHARMRIDEAGRYPAPTFAIEELIYGGSIDQSGARVAGVGDLVYDNEMARQYWNAVSPWIFLPLLLGFAMRAAIVPAHSWLIATNTLAPTSACVLLIGATLACGCYGMARFVVPLFPPYSLNVIPWISAIGVLGGLYAGLLALTQTDIKKTATLACIGQMSLAMAGMFSFNASGVVGGLLLLVSTGFAMAAMMFIVGALEGRTGQAETISINNLHQSPRAAFCLFVAALALVATPGFGGFAASLLTLRGLFMAAPHAGGSPLTAAGGLLMSLCFAWAFVRCFQALRRDAPSPRPGEEASLQQLADRHSPSGKFPDLTCWEIANVSVCLGMAAWIGICPGFFTMRIGQWSSEAHAVDSAFHPRSSDHSHALLPTNSARGSRLPLTAAGKDEG